MFKCTFVYHEPILAVYNVMFLLLALEPAKLEVFMSVHGFVKILEFWLLKSQENSQHKQHWHKAQRVSKDGTLRFMFSVTKRLQIIELITLV